MRKFEYRYHIDEPNRTVVAIGAFAGKVITGVARCDDVDEFDAEIGKKIATARCALKIAKKRMKYANKCRLDAEVCKDYWTDRLEKMTAYANDAAHEYCAAINDINDIQKNFCK